MPAEVKVEPIVSVPQMLWLAVKGAAQMFWSLPWWLMLLVVVTVAIRLVWPAAFAPGPQHRRRG